MSPALFRYSVTTFDPGARLVFTHGFCVSPRSTALRASRPAPIITLGFDVFVQLVIAAITTDPCSSCVSTATAAPPASATFLMPFCSSGSALANDVLAAASVTRSCGRRGPARLGTTVPRSSVSVSVYSASGVESSRNSPCALAYASTSATCASSRPVKRRYSSVISSTGKIATVAPYSGHMLPRVTRSAIVRCRRPGPKNSTNAPTTPFLRRASVMVSTRSVAVAPSGNWPVSR